MFALLYYVVSGSSIAWKDLWVSNTENGFMLWSVKVAMPRSPARSPDSPGEIEPAGIHVNCQGESSDDNGAENPVAASHRSQTLMWTLADFSSYLMQGLNVKSLEEMPVLFEKFFQLRMDTEMKINDHNPIKLLQIGGGNAVRYMSTSVLGNNCSCNITFGAEKLKKKRLIQHVLMYAAEKDIVNMRLQTLLRENFFTEKKSWYKHNCFSVWCIWYVFVFVVWLFFITDDVVICTYLFGYIYIFVFIWKTILFIYIDIVLWPCVDSGFHALINKYLHRDNHGIDPHSDVFGCTYESKDPITSFSYQIGSVLAITLPTAQRHLAGSKSEDCALLVYQPPNSILLMGGEFRKKNISLCAYLESNDGPFQTRRGFFDHGSGSVQSLVDWRLSRKWI